jgi:hypothetical protein
MSTVKETDRCKRRSALAAVHRALDEVSAKCSPLSSESMYTCGVVAKKFCPGMNSANACVGWNACWCIISTDGSLFCGSTAGVTVPNMSISPHAKIEPFHLYFYLSLAE